MSSRSIILWIDGEIMDTFKFHRLAKIVLDQLSAREQASVRRKLASLVGLAPVDWPTRLVKRVRSEPTMFMLRVDNSLRAVLRAVEGEQPEVLDIFRKEAAELFNNGRS